MKSVSQMEEVKVCRNENLLDDIKVPLVESIATAPTSERIRSS
jgi:hypothetical protein